MNRSTNTDRRQLLHRKVDRLADPEVIVVDQFVDAVLAPIDPSLLEGSWLTIKPWADAFLTRLKAHHVLNEEPLSTLAFEAAFNAACVAAGWMVNPATSATNRFFDTSITIPSLGNIRLSLKSSAAKDLKPHRVHISKLTEAAWIQDTRTQADRRKRIVELFREYRDQTDSIIMLRCFRTGTDTLTYELVEIPTGIFSSIDQLTITEAQQGTFSIPPGSTVGDADARIRVDRSDAKITVTSIRIELCKVHGRWAILSQQSITTNDQTP